MAGLDAVVGCSIVDGTVGVSWLDGVGVTDDSVGLDGVREMLSSSSDRGKIGDGPGMDSVVSSTELGSTVEGVGRDSMGQLGVTSMEDSVGSVGEREGGEGARSVGVCSDGSLGLYVDGGSGTSAGSVSTSGSGSTSSSSSLEIGEGADEGMVGISDGGLMLISSASGTRSLHLQSAVLNSVDTSDAHTSAVTYSVSGGGVGQSAAVLYSDSANSLGHFAVSYSVSQMIAVS